MKGRLTNRQLELLVFAREFFKENDQLPTVRALSEHYGLSATYSDGPRRCLKALEEKGYIERNKAGGYRFAREAA